MPLVLVALSPGLLWALVPLAVAGAASALGARPLLAVLGALSVVLEVDARRMAVPSAIDAWSTARPCSDPHLLRPEPADPPVRGAP